MKAHKIVVLSLLFVTVVFFIGSSGVEGAPRKSKLSPNTTIEAKLGKKRVNETSRRNGTTQSPKSSKSTTTEESSSTLHPGSTDGMLESTLKETTKLSFVVNPKDLSLLAHSNISSEVVKRNSLVSIFEVEPQTQENSVEIDIKAYTPHPTASAIIEIRPDPSDSKEGSNVNNLNQNPWTGYQYYPFPQEINWQSGWYLNQNQYPNQPDFSYVPTEELLHSQSYSSNFAFGPHYLYQYPVTNTLKKNDQQATKSNDLEEIKRLNHHVVSQKPDQKYFHSSHPMKQMVFPKPQTPKYFASVPQNSAISSPSQFPYQYIQSLLSNPTIHIQQYQQPISQSIQNPIPLAVIPQQNEIKESVPIKTKPEVIHFKPSLTKYVTSAYYLKKHPRLEWVPL